MPSTSGKKGDRVPNFGTGRKNTVILQTIHRHSNSKCFGFLMWPSKMLILCQLFMSFCVGLSLYNNIILKVFLAVFCISVIMQCIN